MIGHSPASVPVQGDQVSVRGVAEIPRLSESESLRIEYRLLLACAEVRTSPHVRERIATLVQQPLDWLLVSQAAQAHRVAALCYPALQELSPSAVPAEVIATFRRGAMAIAARNLRLASKLVAIVAGAERTEIPLIPYKGPVLAEMAYGSLGLREFVDLDFILPHDHLPAAWKLLEGLGYRPANPALAAPGAPVPGEYIFVAPENDFGVEVHTERTLRHFPAPPDLQSLLGACEPVTLVGKGIRTFSPEDTLMLLVVHGAKDFWAQLQWICDVSWLVQSPGFDWDQALDRCERVGCGRMTHIALLLAAQTFGAPMPLKALRTAQADAGAREAARWLFRRLFATNPIGRLEQLRYRMQMVEGFWPGLRYAGRLATTPAVDDWNSLSLPAPLGFAYALLRPLRLFRR